MLCKNCGCSEWEHRNTFCPDKMMNTYFTDMHYSGSGGESLPQTVTVVGNKIISDETRIVDPLTGGEKGQKTQRFSLIPSGFLWALATHYGVGAKKYDDRNWEKGYKWSLSEDAYSRHFNQWKSGKTHDDETGTHHLICAIWHLIALWWFDTNQKGTDDIRGK